MAGDRKFMVDSVLFNFMRMLTVSFQMCWEPVVCSMTPWMRNPRHALTF